MPIVTLLFAAILVFLGLHGYFGSGAENPSVTALIPAFFGGVLALCGLLALKPSARMHAMHAAVLVGLIGFLLAAGRGAMSVGKAISDDPEIHRGPRLVLLMALTCLVYVGACVASFISARRRRKAADAQA